MSETNETCPCLYWATKIAEFGAVIDGGHHPKCDGTGKRIEPAKSVEEATGEEPIDPNECPKLTLLNELTNQAVYDSRTDMDIRGLLEQAWDAGASAHTERLEAALRKLREVADNHRCTVADRDLAAALESADEVLNKND